MPLLLALILAFFTACSTHTEPSSSKVAKTMPSLTEDQLPVSPQLRNNDIDMNQDIDVNDISGTYELEKGVDNYKTITKANMIIEKLDNQNYGYYYAVQDEKATPNAFFGIFRFKEGTFYSKVIETETTTTLNDNIKLIIEDERLKLTVLTSYGRRIIIWNKVVNKTLIQDKELTNALQDARDSYIEIYKNRFDNLIEI